MFVDEAKQILQNNGWGRIYTSSDLLFEWNQLVETCEMGYSMDISEYENDLAVRGGIELILKEETLHKYPEYKQFKSEVNKIDEDFKKLLFENTKRPDRKTWWEQGVPAKAGKALADDFYNMLGYEIEVAGN